MAAKKILIMDDAKDMLSIYSDMLSKYGYTVSAAQTPEDCLRIARATAPDLILLDVVMPGMDGGTVARHLMEDPRLSSIPVIFLTSMVSPEEAAAVYKPGARMYISKASHPSEIVAAIRKVIG
ncbi:MAG: response regulator [Elusimicrobiales bacterium]